MPEVDNWYEWQQYINQTLDKILVWIDRRETDLAMENLRLQRSLDAALQRIGELEPLG